MQVDGIAAHRLPAAVAQLAKDLVDELDDRSFDGAEPRLLSVRLSVDVLVGVGADVDQRPCVVPEWLTLRRGALFGEGGSPLEAEGPGGRGGETDRKSVV